MKLFDTEENMERGLLLASRVDPKYRAVFDALPDRDRAALALYFLPHGSKKDLLEVTRPRVLKWYCPFADQAKFPSGHRYSINVYAGCEHQCAYCYAAGYVAGEAHCKNSFREDLVKDLDALDAYDVPSAPVHLSNSTDALQPLEGEYRHCLFVLEKLAEVKVEKVIYSVAKITLPRDGRLSPVMGRVKRVYEHLAPKGACVFRGGSWRLPENVAAELVAAPFVDLCLRHAITAQVCKANLISTP